MISKKILGASLLLAILLGGAGFMGVQHFSTQEKSQNVDPLTALLGNDLREKKDSASSFKADFLTNSISPYTGPLSDSLKTCIADNQLLNFLGNKVSAPYDTEAVITQTVKEIQDEIIPVLGHAYANKQINWKYNFNTHTYTFFGHEKDTKLWYCYLQNETKFFKSFLVTEDIKIIHSEYYLENGALDQDFILE